MCEAFFAVHNVLRAGVTLFRQQCRQYSALRGHGIHRVLHHGELAGSYRSQRGMAAGRDSNGMLNFLPIEMQRAPSHKGGNECRQCGMVPTALANAWKRRFAETHFKFVTEHESDDKFPAVRPGTLAASNGSRKNIRGMRWILLPVNIVVVHATDH